MKIFIRHSFHVFVCVLFVSFSTFAQTTIPQPILLKIIRAEDELRFDRDLQELLKSSDSKIRSRAALAAGRIGDEDAVLPLSELLEKDSEKDVRAMAAFALGETESAKAADAILKTLAKKEEVDEVVAFALEAAGKIAAANPKDEKSVELGENVLDRLETAQSSATQNKTVILLGLTAVLRAKPAEADFVVSKFLINKDARVRADALNTLVRLRSKSENLTAQSRAMLLSDDDAVVRANAARALGAAEDAFSLDLLIEAATNDDDQRVRVPAIRSLGNLNDKRAAPPLVERGEKLFAAYKTKKARKIKAPAEKNELLEIVSMLGKVTLKSEASKSVEFFAKFREMDEYQSPETEIALARLVVDYLEYSFEPYEMLDTATKNQNRDWQIISSLAQGFGELSKFTTTAAEQKVRTNAEGVLQEPFETKTFLNTKFNQQTFAHSLPDLLKAYAAFKPIDLSQTLVNALQHEDIVVRAAAAELLGEMPASKENISALQKASDVALKTDKELNDAQLAILSALVKLDKTSAISALINALNAPDFLVRRHAGALIKQNDLIQRLGNVDEKVATVRKHNPASNTKLGQILNTEVDYLRAVTRKNGLTRAVLTTEKGAVTIDLLPEDAPLTVDNFIKLAKSNYFNNLDFHRVVPNFVVQGGDPRGDGNGGPGWQIRCEINAVPFERGAVGMALSGKDTGGSQWFVTHSPQPHLDGGYTVFGRVNETDMKIVDSIARGDKILTVKIIENVSRKVAKTPRKKK